MAKFCQITGKSSLVCGKYSNRVRATKFNPCGNTRRKANLHSKTYFVPEIEQSVTLTVSTRGMRTIAKKGIFTALRDAGILVPRQAHTTA